MATTHTFLRFFYCFFRWPSVHWLWKARLPCGATSFVEAVELWNRWRVDALARWKYLLHWTPTVQRIIFCKSFCLAELLLCGVFALQRLLFWKCFYLAEALVCETAWLIEVFAYGSTFLIGALVLWTCCRVHVLALRKQFPCNNSWLTLRRGLRPAILFLKTAKVMVEGLKIGCPPPHKRRFCWLDKSKYRGGQPEKAGATSPRWSI